MCRHNLKLQNKMVNGLHHHLCTSSSNKQQFTDSRDATRHLEDPFRDDLYGACRRQTPHGRRFPVAAPTAAARPEALILLHDAVDGASPDICTTATVLGTDGKTRLLT